MKTLTLNLKEASYEIHVGRNILDKAGEIFSLKRKTFILTDDGVPLEYSKRIAQCSPYARIHTVKEGEGAKSFSVLSEVLTEMLNFEMTRADCVVAVGGGVVGDRGALAVENAL